MHLADHEYHEAAKARGPWRAEQGARFNEGTITAMHAITSRILQRQDSSGHPFVSVPMQPDWALTVTLALLMASKNARGVDPLLLEMKTKA